MASGDFLSGLSRGIFNETGVMRREQEDRDEKRRADVLNLLAGLTDKVEPESLPVLMSHIGEVMKLKGPMKSFWQAFSGLPDRKFEDTLGTKLNEIMTTAVGPTTAANARQDFQNQLLQPFREQGTRPRSVTELTRGGPPDLKGRMVFRDPRREALDKIVAQFEGREQLQQDRLALQNEFRTRENELKRAHDKDMLSQKFELKRAQTQSELAGWLMTAFPHKYNYDQAFSEAGRRLLNRKEAELDQIRERISLMRDQGALARTQERQLAEGTKPSDVMAERRFDKDQQREFRSLQDALSKAQARGRSIGLEIEAAERELNALAKQLADKPGGEASFDPKTRTFKGTSPGIESLMMVAPKLKRYNELLTERESVLGERRTKYGQITTQFGDYINPTIGEEDEVTLRKEFGGVSPAGAPRTTPGKPKPGPQAGLRGTTTIPVVNPSKYQVGGRIKFGGTWYRITRLKGNFVEGIPER